ncbi:MAG: type I-B CRISPR-associated protein Cas7/Cst2/DevR [Ignavibacteria bacterium]|jgi:CRISPR-associated protein Cst2|nr:type I-B CRISPR-associated protein Cas7/Cst2/DevR [Ignavibacteria bacterium]MCU7504663.1 type I-B CRISPR-associated protein Cas7/Cst2/DevR [Ignavibacteria bacterium]MCU7517529.1 type I-B CRISPR-associated protein Cas7/Cst2/DevR [Ignavibacteria bacterium]
MSKNIIGFVLIDAPHSALNNAGMDEGARTENTVAIKMIRKGRENFPYVSAQAWRYWWRETLEKKFNWQVSPVIRDNKVAYTSANPFLYPDDDIFGYMRAQKSKEGGTLTRLSVLKNSPLISVFPQQPVDDFGVMARQEGNPIPFEHQFYSVVLKGIFSIDMDMAGLFYESNKTGYRNLEEKYVEKEEIQAAINKLEAIFDKDSKAWSIPYSVKMKRIKETISALPYLSGGAKQTIHHTDVTPKFIILAVIEGGNQIFMNITHQDEKKPINIKALEQVISDYRDSIVSDIYIGRQEGFIDNINDDLLNLQNSLKGIKEIHLLSAKQAVESFAGDLEKYYQRSGHEVTSNSN